MRRQPLLLHHFLFAASFMLLGNLAWASSCVDFGLDKDASAIMQLRQSGQEEHSVLTYRDRELSAWFIPLLGDNISQLPLERLSCMLDKVFYFKVSATDPALQHDSDNNTLAFMDISQTTHVIEGRKAPLRSEIKALDSVGVNYQLAFNYVGKRITPSAYADWFAYTDGWYFNTNLGSSSTGKITRFDTYALRESLNTGTYLRLGDAISDPTPLGESQQFAGLSWGTDRNLRPGDYAPVLPTLRNGNVIAGPLEVFINDTLQFQQTLQNGVYDLRNIPAQNGFNSYTVRTFDALGNPVTVRREIYLPASLLPPGITRWRLDTGFQRLDGYSANAHYGAPFVAGRYGVGISHDVSVGAYALVSKAASSFSGEIDQRLSELWTGHFGMLSATNTQQQGHGVQARIDGGGSQWRFLGERTHAFKPLPSIGSRTALVVQQLARAQWSGMAGWNLGLTLAQSQRELSAREDVAILSLSTHIADSGASTAVSWTQTRSAGVKQDNLTISLFLPLTTDSRKNRSLFVSQTNADGVQLSRAQYNSSAQDVHDANWNVGMTHGSPVDYSSIDGAWMQKTDKLELQAMGRANHSDISGQFSLRSGLLWAGGSRFSTRPVAGAFAMVSTAQEGVDIFHENRPVGKTDANGMLLVPSLSALQPNRLSVNPSSWPIHWIGQEVEKQVIAPRGGGVLVSFKINAQAWPEQSLITPVGPDGKLFSAGTVVTAVVDGSTLETVVDRRGQVWIGELLPARDFTISYAKIRCKFSLPMPSDLTGPVTVTPNQCQDFP